MNSNLSLLSDLELHERTLLISRREKETTLSLLLHLHEVETRRVFAARGYGSLWDYTVSALSYSESQASERISAMRLMFRVPEAKKAMESGTLGLTQAALTERHLRREEKEKKERTSKDDVRELLAMVEGRSKRETERVLLKLQPKEIPEESLRQVTETVSEARFPMTEELRKKMERFWQLKGHCSISEVFETCIDSFLKANDPEEKKGLKERDSPALPTKERSESTPLLPAKVTPNNALPQSRYVPTQIKREVYGKSKGQCQYIDPITHRQCESRYLLQHDHIEPFALGGNSQPANLRMLCGTHNRYLGRKMYDPNHQASLFHI